MLEDYFFTKNTKWVLWGTFAIVVALLIFHAGIVVGSHQPMRGRMEIDGGPGGMLGGIMPPQGYVESGHGAVGTIATVTLPTFIIETRDGLTEKVDAGTSTVISGGSFGNLTDLHSGEVVIVIGDPNDSADTDDLDARIIHILPASPKPNQ